MSTITSPGALLERLGIRPVNSGASHGEWLTTAGPELVSTNPATGEPIARVRQATAADYEMVVTAATRAFDAWRVVPAPRRGELIRARGEALRAKKDDLGLLVSLENGKILS